MIRTFRLTNEPGGLGLSLTDAGVSLAGVPLLYRTRVGFHLRPADEVAALIAAAYAPDPTRLRSGLGVIARALESGDYAKAAIAAVQTRTPELSREAAARLAKRLEGLAKYDPDQPRDWHGRWTSAGADGQQAEARRPQANSGRGADAAGRTKFPDTTSLDLALARKYDELGPVEFAKQVIQFGDQLGREGKNLSPAESEHARTEYAFLQDRLSFWLAYEYKPAEAQANLLSAALTLYQGAINGGIVRAGELPRSMLDVGGAAWAFDNVPPRIGPATAKPVVEEPPLPAFAPKEIEGLGGIADNSDVEIIWNGSIKDQGENWEVYNEKANPGAARLVAHAKAFDQYNETTREAISNKTLNTLSVSYIRKSAADLRADDAIHRCGCGLRASRRVGP